LTPRGLLTLKPDIDVGHLGDSRRAERPSGHVDHEVRYRTPVEDLYINRFAGKIRLTEAEWTVAKKNNEEFQRMFS
jgi:hypothetical protein